LTDLVTDDAQQFAAIAIDLAGNLPKLRRLRATLRSRMQASPLMDSKLFAREMESAYRTMWRHWCVGTNNPPVN
jgi:predicted O-linked N-acetylglucosamine transferase (SPINDLY family)